MLGLLALGDSITNGGGELQWGVALQSWALWTARGLGLPYTTYATDGASTRDVVERQIPAHDARFAIPDGRFHVGALYAGVNDVRTPGWDPTAYERDLTTALGYLEQRCERVLACTIPEDLGRPRAGASVLEANRVIRRHARLVVGLEDFGGRNRVMVDAVHPTAFGQIAIAERALDVLGRDGMDVRVRPHTLIVYDDSSRRHRLRGDATYVWRQLKQSGGILARRLR